MDDINEVLRFEFLMQLHNPILCPKVLYTSDHGDMLSSHGMLGKQLMLEESVRVPLLMRLPGVIPPGWSLGGNRSP